MPEQSGLTPVMTVDAVNDLLDSVFPQLNGKTRTYSATAIFPGGCSVRLDAGQQHLRPGDTVSGPSLFSATGIISIFKLN